MQEVPPPHSLLEFLEAWIGAAGTSLLASAAGRLTYYATKVPPHPWLWREMAWEIPIAVSMAIIGEAVAAQLGASRPVSTGIVAALAYVGPRETTRFAQWVMSKLGGKV